MAFKHDTHHRKLTIAWHTGKSTKKYNAKVRCHPGACVDDLYDYIAPLIKKKPSNIIMQIGSNDATFKTAEEILSEILNLKHYILKVLPGSKVYVVSVS